ncbi:MAG TPA: type II toxin-antitoxin system Phd/YefM family antitoxin [Candidatus Scybalocola faecigallinarum]|uniref:Antitoxin n=1 Tax=Candidatus Scybalocola faecigallinarum TaxID=2840941 RepID=A0A9D1F4M3_9FIRM|nr:type II toxin-antitoxin system Phd/YefM family antitoxin [Candidatus Scybalocola faecigallinarum]
MPSLVDLTERLVPISDFSQGKTGKIFSDVSENDHEYIILKNNQPTAVIMSIKEYKETQQKLEKLEKFLEKINDIHLLQQAEDRENSATSSFNKFVIEQGYSLEDIDKLAESVEIE